MSRITQQELESYLWGAAVLLRGLIDAGDYKQFIFPLLFYKRVADVWDEEYQAALANSGGDLSYAQFAENHRFQIPEGAHWNDVRQTPKNVGAAIQKAMRAIETANPDLLDGIFGDAPWTNRERLPDETLKNLIEHFSTQTLSVANVPEDELGNAYEYLIKNFAASGGQKAGEFYTPPEVSDLIAELLEPQQGDTICDPACGSGSLLMKCGRKVVANHGEKHYALYGQEAIGSTWSLAKMNMFLHGEDNHRIEWGDTIRNPKLLDGAASLKHFDIRVDTCFEAVMRECAHPRRPDGWIAEEHLHVPHPDKPADTDGWIIGSAYHWPTEKTTVSVLSDVNSRLRNTPPTSGSTRRMGTSTGRRRFSVVLGSGGRPRGGRNMAGCIGIGIRTCGVRCAAS